MVLLTLRSGVELGSNNKTEQQGTSGKGLIDSVDVKPQKQSRWNGLAEKTVSGKDLREQTDCFSEELEIAAAINNGNVPQSPVWVSASSFVRSRGKSGRSRRPLLRRVVSNAMKKPYAILVSIARAETTEVEERLRSLMADMSSSSCPRQALARHRQAQKKSVALEHQEDHQENNEEGES